MAKTLISEEELLSILNNSLQNDVDCAGYSFGGFTKHGTETVDCNWDVKVNSDDTVTALGERKVFRIIGEAKNEYNLK